MPSRSGRMTNTSFSMGSGTSCPRVARGAAVRLAHVRADRRRGDAGRAVVRWPAGQWVSGSAGVARAVHQAAQGRAGGAARVVAVLASLGLAVQVTHVHAGGFQGEHSSSIHRVTHQYAFDSKALERYRQMNPRT